MSVMLSSVISLVFSIVNLSYVFVLFPAVVVFALCIFNFTFRLIRGDF